MKLNIPCSGTGKYRIIYTEWDREDGLLSFMNKLFYW